MSCYLKIIWTAFICGLKKLWFNSILMQAFHSMPRLGMLTYLPDKHFNHVSCTCVCYFPWQVISQIVKTTPSISKGSRKFFRTLQNNGILNICIMLFVKQNYMYLHCCNNYVVLGTTHTYPDIFEYATFSFCIWQIWQWIRVFLNPLSRVEKSQCVTNLIMCGQWILSNPMT